MLRVIGNRMEGTVQSCTFARVVTLTGDAYCRTVTEYVADMQVFWLGASSKGFMRIESFQHTIAGPLLHDDMEDTWERLREKYNWTDLHYLLARPPGSHAELKNGLVALLEYPSTTWQLNFP